MPHRKIGSVDILILIRQLSTLLSAGIPLLHALDCIGLGHQNSTMKMILLTLRTSISEGRSFSDSLSQHPRCFEPLLCHLIRAAEGSGTLDIMLKRIANSLEKSASLKKKIKQALIYPITIITLTLIVSLFLILFIVPEFQDLFSSFGTDLPPFTRLIIKFSTFIQQQGWLLLLFTILTVYVIKTAIQHSSNLSYFCDKNLLKAFLVGPLMEKAILARLSRTLATLLDAGTPLMDALTATANTADNKLYQNALQDLRQNVSSGQSIYTAMTRINENTLFPPLLKQMIRVGEETGSLTAMLEKIADYYEEDVDERVNNLSQLMEPLIMLILGTVVGCFVIAMYLPIFKLGSLF